MKTKKFSKKLTLNKKTIADLNNGEMKNVHGGGDEQQPASYLLSGCMGCPTYPTVCDTCICTAPRLCT